jgi:hypothetical protein
MDPLAIPFGSIIGNMTDLADARIDPPGYSLVPGFRWDLSCLLRDEWQHDPARLITFTDRGSTAAGLELLRNHSVLDPSQGNAVMNVLTQGMSLLQVRS